MTADELTRFLHGHVPLSAAMQVRALEVSAQRVVLQAPLAPNINQHGTVFGGSGATLAVLAAWSVLHTRLAAAGIDCTLVVQSSGIDYDAPMRGAFEAVAVAPAESDWQAFTHGLRTRRKARAQVLATLVCDGATAARFHGRFVGIRAP